MSHSILIGLKSVVSAATPVVFAVIGETLIERSGIINLSINGAIVLTAMTGFVTSLMSGSIIVGFVSGALVGAFVSFIIAFSNISLKQSQVAVGFVLAILCRELAYFLGNPFMGEMGPLVSSLRLPIFADIPIIGELFFQQNLLVYLSYALIVLSYVWIFYTRQGLLLRAVGENPKAAFIRGVKVNRMRYLYTILGGVLIGLSGPMYSLSIKAGWKGTVSG